MNVFIKQLSGSDIYTISLSGSDTTLGHGSGTDRNMQPDPRSSCDYSSSYIEEQLDVIMKQTTDFSQSETNAFRLTLHPNIY